MSDITTIETRMKALNDTIAAERKREWVVMANLGQAVRELGISEDGPLAEAGKNVDQISSEIRDLEDSFRNLHQGEEKRNEIHEERKALNVELRNIKNKEEQTLEDLGRVSWDQWKSGKQVGIGMEEALDVLIRAERRVRSVEDEVFRNNAEVGNTPSIIKKSKALFLAGRKRTAAAAFDRLWGKAGAAVWEKVSVQTLSEGPTATPSAVLQAMDERKEEIRLRTASMETEEKALDEAMDVLPGKGGVKKRSSWIENALETHRIMLDDAFRDLGEAWLENLPKVIPGGDVSERKKEHDEILTGIEKLLEEKRGFENHLEYLEILDRRDSLVKKTAGLDADIKAKQAELKGLKKKLSGMEKDLEKRRENLTEFPEEQK